MPPGLSSAMTLKRIQRELADLKKEDLGDMVLQPSETNLHVWAGSIPGPQGSLYEGGVFELEMLLPSDYPFSAPKVLFKTRIYHMNISEHGAICIDILKGQWSPALSLFKVMLSLSSLLTDPNPKDPLVPSIAQQYLRSRKQHDETARQWVKSFAMPKPPPAVPDKPEKANGKGKARASASQTASGSASTSSQVSTPALATSLGGITATRRSTRSNNAAANTSSSSTTTEPIVLSDSDGEGAERPAQSQSQSQSKKRKRGSDVAAASTTVTAASSASVSRTKEVLELEDSDEEREAPPRQRRTVSSQTAISGTRDEVIVLD